METYKEKVDRETIQLYCNIIMDISNLYIQTLNINFS